MELIIHSLNFRHWIAIYAVFINFFIPGEYILLQDHVSLLNNMFCSLYTVVISAQEIMEGI